MSSNMDINLDQLYYLLYDATDGLSQHARTKVFQQMAQTLIAYGFMVSHDDLRRIFNSYNIPIEQRCVMCQDLLPMFNEVGDPICSDCDISDLESEG